MKKNNAQAHRSACLRLVLYLLATWFLVSFGAGILFREQLDSLASVGNAPLGFWMAQQGSIICFVIILIIYAVRMNVIDKKFGFEDVSPKEKSNEQS